MQPLSSILVLPFWWYHIMTCCGLHNTIVHTLHY